MLEQIQRLFRQAHKDSENTEAFLQLIDASKSLSAKRRFEIYQSSIQECLARALREIYPVCEQLVGADNFNRMAYRYVHQTPSYSPDLNDYGHDFPDFIEPFPPAQELPYLRDLCLLELAWHLAYYYPEYKPLDLEALETVPEQHQEHLVFHLPESANLLYSPYPIKQLWEAAQQNQLDDPNFSIEPVANQLIVWRHETTIHIDTLTDTQWNTLMAISEGVEFGELCEDPTILSDIVSRGWIGGYTFSNNNKDDQHGIS